MNLNLSNNEQQLKEWKFVELENGLAFENNVVITNKRVIYQKEIVNSNIQRAVSRFDVGVDNIKAVSSTYGALQNKLWLTLGIVGIFMALLGVFMLLTEEVGMGIFMLLIGCVLAVGGIYLHMNPEKSPIKVKQPNFMLNFETKTPDGSIYRLGAGKSFSLKGKRPYNMFLLILLTMCGIIPGIAYYILRTQNNKGGLEMPEEIAIEIIEIIGSLIFN